MFKLLKKLKRKVILPLTLLVSTGIAGSLFLLSKNDTAKEYLSKYYAAQQGVAFEKVEEPPKPTPISIPPLFVQHQIHALYRQLELLDKDVDVIDLFTDHFGPPEETQFGKSRVKDWCEKYPKLASAHLDSDGIPLQHTFFYITRLRDPPLTEREREFQKEALREITKKLIYPGFVEREIHTHHYYQGSEEKTRIELRERIREELNVGAQFGAHITAERTPRFPIWGFIHGVWALDNLPKNNNIPLNEFCGISFGELEILLSEGCYADFTLGCWDDFNGFTPAPRVGIFRVKDDHSPASWRNPKNRFLCEVNKKQEKNSLLFFTRQEYDGFEWVDPTQIGSPSFNTSVVTNWVTNTNMYVLGRPEWIFINTWAHGHINNNPYFESMLFGRGADSLYATMEELLRDKQLPNGHVVRLHHATAREAYNIVRAAEDGKEGNPNQFRNYEIPPYADRVIYVSSPWKLESYTDKEAIIQVPETPGRDPLEIRVKGDMTRAWESEGKEGGEWKSSDAEITRHPGEIIILDYKTPSQRYKFN